MISILQVLKMPSYTVYLSEEVSAQLTQLGVSNISKFLAELAEKYVKEQGGEKNGGEN